MKNATVLGATGLVGRALLQALLANNDYQQIRAIARKPRPSTLTDPRLIWIQSDFENADWHDAMASDDVYCALGTTIKIAGTQQRFRAVDFDLVCDAARQARQRGCTHFLVVSALGANATSSVFYNRVKGEMELVVQQLQFARLSIFRPSLLSGPREEFRPMERLLLPLSFLLPLKWKPISDVSVARAMIQLARHHPSLGLPTIIESDTMQRLALSDFSSQP